MANDNNNEKANELLTNWSKWLITINFVSATGCVVALKTAGQGAERTGPVFFAAILSFTLSVACATRFVFLLAKQGAQKPGNIPSNSYLWLATLQWILFITGLLFVLVWIGFIAHL